MQFYVQLSDVRYYHGQKDCVCNVACRQIILTRYFHYIIFGCLASVCCLQVEWPMKLWIAEEAVCGMKYLHIKDPPVIHGDLKVQNVLIGDDYHAKASEVFVFIVHLSYNLPTNNRTTNKLQCFKLDIYHLSQNA